MGVFVWSPRRGAVLYVGGNSGHVRCSPRSPSGMPSRGTTNRHGPQAAGSVARSGAEQLHEPARADLAIRRAETTRVTTRDLIRAAESLSSRRGKRRRRACRGPGAPAPRAPVVGCAAWTRRNVCQNTPGLIDYLDTMYVNDT